MSSEVMALMKQFVSHIRRKGTFIAFRNFSVSTCACYNKTVSWSFRKTWHLKKISYGFHVQDRLSSCIRRGMTELAATNLSSDNNVTEFSNDIKETQNFDHLLDIVSSERFIPQHVPLVLEQILSINQMNVKTSADTSLDLIATAGMDVRLSKVCSAIRNKSIPSSNILLQAEYLKFLSVMLNISSQETPIVIAMEDYLFSNMKKMSMSNLIKTLQLYKKHNETTLRKNAYDTACALIRRRWVEVSRPNQIISLAMSYNGNVCELLDKFEDIILTSSQHMTPNSIYNMIYAFSRRGYRNSPVLRSLVHHLKKTQEWNFQFYHLKNLLYACSVLKVHDTELFDRISDLLISKLNESMPVGVASFISVLTSIGKLQFLNESLLDNLYRKIYANRENLTDKHIASVLISMGKLNYPDKSLVDHLKKELTSLSLITDLPDVWLDVIWHLVALQQGNNFLMSSVLKKSFYENLLALESKKSLMNKVKLKNIETGVKLGEIDEYNGLFLPDDFLMPVNKPPFEVRSPLKESVLLALGNFVPLEKYVKTDVFLPQGYTIDAELFVDGKGQPIAYEQAIAQQYSEHKRIAILVINFMDMTCRTVQLTGINAMAIRHLKKMGYAVVEIPYSEFSELHTAVRKVTYIHRQINSAISTEKSHKQSSTE